MIRYLCLLIVALSLPVSGCSSKSSGGGSPGNKEASEKRLQANDAIGRSDWAGAIRLLDDAVKLEPGNVDGWWLRGLAHLKKKDYEKAEADCSEALKLDSNFAPAFRERGYARKNLKKYDAAVEDFTAYIKLRPEDPEGYEGRAVAYWDGGDKAKASADLRKAGHLKKK
jgi:tetratricopeptide (TPR) repeat protein